MTPGRICRPASSTHCWATSPTPCHRRIRRCRAPAMDWHILWEYRAALWSGLVVTVWISAAGIAGSTVVGVVIGCLGSTPSFYLRKLTSAYTELLRNLPLLVKVFFFYFVLSRSEERRVGKECR